MTTDGATPPADRSGAPRRRRRHAPAGRALATGAALTATGLLVAVMGAAADPSTVQLVSPSTPVATAPAASSAPPTTIVVIHRPAPRSGSVASAPSAGRAVPAPRPAVAPPPAATSTAS